jgi:hypothetical protein
MITLIPTTEGDIDFVLAAEAQPDTSAFIIPWTRERHLQAIVDEDCAHRIVTQSDTGDRLGFLMLFGLPRTEQSNSAESSA